MLGTILSPETAEQPTATKRGRGRPKGSKSKNRIREESILVPAPIRRPRHYNLSEAAAELNISHTYLGYDLVEKYGDICRPAAKNGRHIIYTDVQIQIISLVMWKKITPEEGLKMFRRIEDEELATMARRMQGGEA